MLEKVYLKWEDINIKWEDLNLTWEEIYILEEVANVIRKHGGSSEYVKGNPWDITKREIGEEKTDIFIRLFCKVNNIKYEKIIKPNNKIKITAKQIEKVFNESIKIGIKFNI